MLLFPIAGSDILYQSRADTCMLRYNQSTILKLYAITRHVKPPGAVIFSTDDLLLQLNETEQLKEIRNQLAVSALKHPKMFKKNPKENFQENFPEAQQESQRPLLDENNVNDFQQIDNAELLQPKKSFRGLSVPEDPTNLAVYGQQANEQYASPNNYGREDYRSKNRHTNEQQQQQQIHGKQSYQPQQPNLDEYEYYDDIRPKKFNDKYSINRGIRSELNEDLDSTVAPLDYVHRVDQQKMPTESKSRSDKQETLWDLEMEKEEMEEKEALNGKYDIIAKILRKICVNSFALFEFGFVLDLNGYSSKEKRKYNSKKILRRDTPNIPLSLETGQGILPAISSVGVLLKSIDNTNSTLDFVFVLTVRESELYPPLFLPEDVTCIEEKLNSYRSEFSANGTILVTKKTKLNHLKLSLNVLVSFL